MRFTRPLKPVAAAAAISTLLLAGCGGGHHASTSGPTTTLITADNWSPPVVPGPPSESKFCALLVADYQHLATIAQTSDLKVRQAIVGDAIRFAPTVAAAAPPPIAAAAKVYLTKIAQVLTDLNAAGLNASKVPRGSSMGSILLDPEVAQTGKQVVTYSSQNCHYNIGG